MGINKEKTKVVKIGPVRDRSINWEGKLGLKWTDEFEVLGISYNSNKMGEIRENNISKKNQRHEKHNICMEDKKTYSIW